MLIDKLVLTITGHLLHPSGVDCAVDVYREALSQRATTPLGRWTSPTRAAHEFRTTLNDTEGTIAATLICRNEKTRAAVRLHLTLNPTKTLVHALAHAADIGDLSEITALAPETFFARHRFPRAAPAVDHNDNAIGSYDEAKAALSGTIADPFLLLFEDRLRSWLQEAVAPLDVGFAHSLNMVQPVAQFDDLTVTLLWDSLIVRKAEVYCERRHSGARQAIERLSARLNSANANSTWHSYPTEEHGSRSGRSISVGFSPTKDIRQAYYAKCPDRIRIETRYDKRILNAVGYPDVDQMRPLISRLAALRADAVRRGAYSEFCKMIKEPTTATVSDLASLVAAIAECATQARVRVAPVVTSLLSTGSIDQTDTGGEAPQRLIDRLCDARLIERSNLARRRPGEPLRYTLVGVHHDAVRQLQKAFQDQEREG